MIKVEHLSKKFGDLMVLRDITVEIRKGDLKLIGGILMLTLAAVMIIKPSLLNTLSSALVIFGIAFTLILLVLLLHRRILPAMGIYIGTEMEGKNKSKKSKSGQPRKRHAK